MVVKPLIAIIKSYQKWISPLLPARCRYQPTCSQYCIEALSIHGLFKG
ncbi:MAG TPA: membrane protein insertion efficiency factor YidD, partial [Flavobacteriaceae bacterium]|nr:membrane protein insertion efficiency factor YidD [Flavobacteriaceae bacterium]